MSEYNIKVELEEKTYVFLCPEDQDIVSAAKDNGIDLPNSCCSGVCTSCASMVIEGSVDQEDAMGLNDDLKEKGFALLCVAYPKTNLHIIVGDIAIYFIDLYLWINWICHNSIDSYFFNIRGIY